MKIRYYILFIILLFNIISCSIKLDKYENIIFELKKLNFTNGKLNKYKISDFTDISTLKEVSNEYVSERGKGKGDIWVYKTDENLIIFIEVKDLGHAGEFGFVYSESGIVPQWDHDSWGEFWTIDEKINNHWWKISYRLD